MYLNVKCPYCKGKQEIYIDLVKFENGYKYFDCLHCLDVFEVELKAVSKWVDTAAEQEKKGMIE